MPNLGEPGNDPDAEEFIGEIGRARRNVPAPAGADTVEFFFDEQGQVLRICALDTSAHPVTWEYDYAVV